MRRTSQLRSKTLCKQLSGFLLAITRSLNPLTVDYVKQVANKRPRLHAPTIDDAFQIIVLFPTLPCSDLVQRSHLKRYEKTSSEFRFASVSFIRGFPFPSWTIVLGSRYPTALARQLEGAVEMAAVEWRAPDMRLFVPKEVHSRRTRWSVPMRMQMSQVGPYSGRA